MTAREDRHLHVVPDAPTDDDMCAAVVELLVPSLTAPQFAQRRVMDAALAALVDGRPFGGDAS